MIAGGVRDCNLYVKVRVSNLIDATCVEIFMIRLRMPKILAYGAALTAVAMAAGGCSDWEPPPKPVSNWTIDDARAFDEFGIGWVIPMKAFR